MIASYNHIFSTVLVCWFTGVSSNTPETSKNHTYLKLNLLKKQIHTEAQQEVFSSCSSSIKNCWTNNIGYSWHHQQHPKLLCCVRLGSVWNWISRIHSIQRNWNTRLMLFSDSSMSFIHLLPKTSFLRQLSMSYWGCWVTHVSFLCSKCKANYFIA